MDTQRPSLFISSCTRRQMARRRSSRSVLRLQWAMATLLLAAALGAFVAVHGGL